MTYIVALEGLSSAGKTTLAREIRRQLGTSAIMYLHEDAPADTELSSTITMRDPWTRDLIYAASAISMWRIAMSSETPITIIDRYIDSLYVYSSREPPVIRHMLNVLIAEIRQPDLVIWLDTPLPEIQERRLAACKTFDAVGDALLRRRYKTALEARYGASGQLLIVRDEATQLKAIEYLQNVLQEEQEE